MSAQLGSSGRERAQRLAACAALWLAVACTSAPPPPEALRAAPPPPSPWFRIRVVDAATGRGVPAVELRTTDARVFYTDSAGMVAFGEPDLLGAPVWLGVRSFGYHYPDRVYGDPAVLLEPRAGGEALLRIERDNVAQRLYRVTGSGIYRDSRLLGDRVPELREGAELPPTGMDSAQTESYRGQLFWTWGDTKFTSSLLGNFRTSAATSELPALGGLDPDVGVRFAFLREPSGRVRSMVDDPHPMIWLSALRSARDLDGAEHLFATYRKVVPPMTTVELGLAEYDDAAGVFRIVQSCGRDEARVPDGHTFRDGEHIYYDARWRSTLDAASVRDLARYESFTPLAPGARYSPRGTALERDAADQLVWAWKRDTPPLRREDWDALERAGQVAPDEAQYRLVDVETGATLKVNGGSIAWNPYRQRWIRIETQIGGQPSFLGEVWYFEADTPVGPWAYGRRILTHGMPLPRGEDGADDGPDTYSFYNPTQHPEFARDGGREIYFEGTFSAAFTPHPAPVPGYDYNQLMYKLDLDDPRLALPVAIYRTGSDGRLAAGPEIAAGAERRLAFFAPDRPGAGRVAVREAADPAAPAPAPRLVAGEAAAGARFFCASPALPAPPGTVPLYELHGADGGYSYATDVAPEARDGAAVLCHVWPRLVRFDPFAPPARAAP